MQNKIKVFIFCVAMFCGCFLSACSLFNRDEEKPTEYAITYELNGGIASGSNPSSYSSLDPDIMLSRPIKSGFEFTGWSELKGEKFSPSKASWDKTFTANWSTPGLVYQRIIAGFVDIEVKKGEAIIGKSVTISDFYFGEEVDGIGTYAFSDCTELEKIRLPEELRFIDDYAFSGCKNLRAIEIPNVYAFGNSVFYGCESLTQIALHDDIISISDSLFSGCSSLESIVLPERLLYIESDAFYGCSRLKSVVMPESLERIQENAFYGCSSLQEIKIPQKVKLINEFAFFGCASLKELHIPKNVNTHSDSPLIGGGCSALKKITVDPENVNFKSFDGVLYDKKGTKMICYPAAKEYKLSNILAGVTVIGRYSFNSHSMEELMIPDGIKKIEAYAFENCKNLTSISMTTDIEGIGAFAFAGCTSLKSFYIPPKAAFDERAWVGCENLTNIDVDLLNKTACSVDGVLYSKSKDKILHYPAGKIGTPTILEETSVIGSYAFFENTKLTKLVIGDNVEDIKDSAFSGCVNLNEIVLPASITLIGSYAFANCTSIKELTIPDTVENLRDSVFCNWTAGQTIKVKTHLQAPETWSSSWNKDCAANIVFASIK